MAAVFKNAGSLAEGRLLKLTVYEAAELQAT
jgi:hypothetical protein